MSQKPVVDRLVPFAGKFIISNTVPPVIIKVAISKSTRHETFKFNNQNKQTAKMSYLLSSANAFNMHSKMM